MKYFRKLNKGIEIVLKVAAVALVAFMCSLAVFEVVRRYLFHTVFTWSDEALRYSMVGAAFLGAAIAFRGDGLVQFDLLLNKISGKTRKIIDLIIIITYLPFISYIFYKSLMYTFSPVVVNQISAGTKFSMAVVYVSMPIGFGAMILFGLEKLIDAIGALCRKEDAA